MYPPNLSQEEIEKREQYEAQCVTFDHITYGPPVLKALNKIMACEHVSIEEKFHAIEMIMHDLNDAARAAELIEQKEEILTQLQKVDNELDAFFKQYE